MRHGELHAISTHGGVSSTASRARLRLRSTLPTAGRRRDLGLGLFLGLGGFLLHRSGRRLGGRGSDRAKAPVERGDESREGVCCARGDALRERLSHLAAPRVDGGDEVRVDALRPSLPLGARCLLVVGDVVHDGAHRPREAHVEVGLLLLLRPEAREVRAQRDEDAVVEEAERTHACLAPREVTGERERANVEALVVVEAVDSLPHVVPRGLLERRHEIDEIGVRRGEALAARVAELLEVRGEDLRALHRHTIAAVWPGTTIEITPPNMQVSFDI